MKSLLFSLLQTESDPALGTLTKSVNLHSLSVCICFGIFPLRFPFDKKVVCWNCAGLLGTLERQSLI